MKKQQIEESNLNRILSHLKDKDVAMITTFRTNPDLQLSKTNNRKRNKKLEDKLKSLGYQGFTKVVGHWNETPKDDISKAIAEESYIVLNTGSSFKDFVVDMILLSKDVDNNPDFDQQAIVVWSHVDQKAYLISSTGDILTTFNNFSLDSISQEWTQIKGHKLTFIEEDINSDYFSDTFNKGGNFMTAMMYSSNRRKHRNI